MESTVAKSEFIESIDAEKNRISARFLEIDDNISRMEKERRLMQERVESIEHIRELYLRTELAMQEINQAAADISHFASHDLARELSNGHHESSLMPR